MLFETHGTCVLSQVDFLPARTTKGNNMATKTKTSKQARKPLAQEAAKKPTAKATTTRAPKAKAEIAKQDTEATVAKQVGKKGKAKPEVKAEAIESANAKSAADAPVTKKLSAIDAAAQVLASAGPLNCKELIEAMATQGLWTSPGGKTPHATLYSAILREITVKGHESRFVKTERGRFAAR